MLFWEIGLQSPFEFNVWISNLLVKPVLCFDCFVDLICFVIPFQYLQHSISTEHSRIQDKKCFTRGKRQRRSEALAHDVHEVPGAQPEIPLALSPAMSNCTQTQHTISEEPNQVYALDYRQDGLKFATAGQDYKVRRADSRCALALVLVAAAGAA